MRLWRRRERIAAPPDVARGICRVGRRTKELVKRLDVGEIAIIDHVDIDPVAAEGLVASGVAAVVNAAPSISGRYPNTGPLRLVQEGILLLDDVGSAVMDAVRDGEELEISNGALWRGGEKVAQGEVLDEGAIRVRMEQAHLQIGAELKRFAFNTLEFIDREAVLLFEPLPLPAMRTKIRGRHALVVVRGVDYKQDLAALRAYIKEWQPVLIGVDGGADALLETGFRPDLIVGDFDSVSERAMRSGAELVAHAHSDGTSPAADRLRTLDLSFHTLVAPGTSEDVAMLLAAEAGASLIVAVGTHATMVEFLDKGRRGMASTFLTRLRLGPVLVDAKGVSRLYEGRVRRGEMLLLVAAALLAVLAMIFASDSLQVFLRGLRLTFEDLWSSLTNGG